MHRTATSKCHQQNRLQAYRENCDSYRYFNLLTSEALLEKVEGLLPEHRERLYPPTETLSMFLGSAGSEAQGQRSAGSAISSSPSIGNSEFLQLFKL